MDTDGPLWEEQHIDWTGLQEVFPERDDVAGWMWMHAWRCEETGELVHFYKHHATRRYLRLDRHGLPYSEDLGGNPHPLDNPGVMLLELIAEVYRRMDFELPTTIRIPAALRPAPPWAGETDEAEVAVSGGGEQRPS